MNIRENKTYNLKSRVVMPFKFIKLNTHRFNVPSEIILINIIQICAQNNYLNYILMIIIVLYTWFYILAILMKYTCFIYLQY